jgi:GNAT superfamily N-acetyltransferase
VRVSDARVTVRRAVEGDGPAIGDAHAAAWLVGYEHAFKPVFLARAAESRRTGWPEALTRILIEPGFVLVAELDDEVVAFAHAGPAHDGRAIGEIYGFYAHPKAWGTTVAATLMAESCAELAGEWHDVILWTLEAAGRARRFYEKVGFVATGAVKDETLTAWGTEASVTRTLVEYRKALLPS